VSSQLLAAQVWSLVEHCFAQQLPLPWTPQTPEAQAALEEQF
jgi:hypothetical protein